MEDTSFVELLGSSAAWGVAILGAMAVASLVETVVPLCPRGRSSRGHLVPNLALTAITLATNAVFNAGLLLALLWSETNGVGMLNRLALPHVVSVAVVVVALDFATYLAHVGMHMNPALWRIHAVHHSDPMVDVTTTIRQHPGEGVVRYAAMGAAAIMLGASPAAFAVYRLWSALNGLPEHANVHMPRRLDALLSLLVVTPNMHKVHHSRVVAETNSNYGNLLSLFDRAFSTFTPSPRGLAVVYGLDGYDEPGTQSAAGLLALPFRATGNSAEHRPEHDPDGAGREDGDRLRRPLDAR